MARFRSLLVICNLILTVLFVGFLRWDWQGRMYAQVITCAGFAVLAFYILTKKELSPDGFPKKEDFVGAYRFWYSSDSSHYFFLVAARVG